jgi:isopentenyl diphosphate isomerase/L-lactate dehydrogenase-like FMN-dependent dehydrogenase
MIRILQLTLAVLEREIVTAMQLMGVSKLDQLKPEMVECLKEFWV